jgi:7-keto-8-aminopelargonate synthetase-like enzyme
MEWMSRADIVLLSVAGYVAVMALVRLMKQRHDVVVADVERQIKAHRRAVKRRREKEEKDEHRDAA